MAHGQDRKKLIPFFPANAYLKLKLLFKTDHLIKSQILKCLALISDEGRRQAGVFIPVLGPVVT